MALEAVRIGEPLSGTPCNNLAVVIQVFVEQKAGYNHSMKFFLGE